MGSYVLSSVLYVDGHANTVTCELELPLANHFADLHLVNSFIKSLVCYMVSRLFDTQQKQVKCSCKDVKFKMSNWFGLLDHCFSDNDKFNGFGNNMIEY